MIYAYAPLSLEEVAKLRWLDDINVILNKSLASAKPEVGVSAVDPVAAANVDEDWTIELPKGRSRPKDGARSWPLIRTAPMRNLRGLRSTNWFRPRRLPRRRAAQASNGGSSDTKTPSDVASPGRTSQPSEVATLASDEICKRDEDRLERLSNSPTSDEAMRFLTELRCEKLRPELFRLTERLDYQDSHGHRRCCSKSFFNGRSSRGCKTASD